MDDFKNWRPLNTHAQETQPNDSNLPLFTRCGIILLLPCKQCYNHLKTHSKDSWLYGGLEIMGYTPQSLIWSDLRDFCSKETYRDMPGSNSLFFVSMMYISYKFFTLMQITFEKFLLLIVYFFGICIFMKVDRFFCLSVGFVAAATA